MAIMSTDNMLICLPDCIICMGKLVLLQLHHVWFVCDMFP